jgi:cell growth-regulating nucleolar protein
VNEDASPAPSTSAIHPSRLQIIESAPPAHAYGNPASSRGGPGGRGVRGGFAPPAAPRGGRGFGRAAGVTGENRVAPPTGMRSWGSTPLGGSPVPESSSASVSAPVAVPVHANGNVNGNGPEKKKKGKKGDKGGTGSKAGIKASHNIGLANAGETVLVAPAPPVPAPAASTNGDGDEPSIKKRKRDSESAAPVTQITSPATTTSAPSEKTLKRLRKNLSKLDSADNQSISLSEYIGRIGKGKKDETIDREQVLAGLKVGLEGGKWVLSV